MFHWNKLALIFAVLLCSSNLHAQAIIATDPAGTEAGMVVRNIPSGTQTTAPTSGVAGGTASNLTDVLVREGCIRDDATSTLDSSHADGDWTHLRCNARGGLWVSLETALSATIDSVEAKGANAASKINCTSNAFLNMSTATTTEIVALSGSTAIYICSYSIVLGGTVASLVKFVAGTGTACATSQEDRTANLPLDPAARPGIARGSGEGMLFKTAAGDALCVTSSAAGNPLAIDISYAQY